ncbi:cysteine dioxygenase family protein [Saccharomonospora xinjiangensis]|uniref:Putative metal-dependent enzyme of the double-stranded beta helix superfamily n=1 Tax=Saccharomonospora xinjiangensis XJ-54 TaxID=882086 RepID=I0V806_9PSEU|nr:cysteine dioxygenase family protein [Saccharomonospora xinjiangensis]EID56259.1 putative metal-dependent enzyme of the double-stranded beta helix superfamily [Saccharomonospora xinjiangensis XJ-54]QBQ60715.1 Cysteine dioxygenase type I [Saccharomonospora xinjiangensis]
MTTRTSEPLTTEFAALVASVRKAVHSEVDPSVSARRVGDLLTDRLAEGLPLPAHLRGHNPDHYTQHLVHAEPDGAFSIVALVWLPGQATPIHDHVSWCVTGVVEGQETEEVYEIRQAETGPCLVRTGTVINVVGAVSALDPPGDIHRVRNSCTELAVSLHIYGADIRRLGSSIRRTYDLPVLDPAR